ncbi:MAG: DEAD/DEAH box helicase [Deltaproteobacteria bacterium]|nr:DEAD/DEAH box helicase [Deltaproteobacteria bacterium]
MESFKELSLPAELYRAIEKMGYTKPTPIQAQAIPVILAGRDVMGCAQTGTGKTAAFGIPTIINLIQNPKKTALILAPTRELALQIDDVFGELTSQHPEIRTAILIGGASMNPQISQLRRNPRIIIATPGRLLDHLRRKTANIANTGILILDEADRMLDMGFAPQLNDILRYVPKQRQTLLFSATFEAAIVKLAQKYLANPERITIGQTSTPVKKIAQSVVETTVKGKNDTLVDELDARAGSVLIFARTKRRTDKLARYLSGCGYKVDRIHGDRSQRQRVDAIDGFRDGKFDILVATDIAARGIDIPHIAHVINYDLPMTPEDYVHRIGRTARAGADGQALSLITPEDRGQWRLISKLIDKASPARGN